MKWSHEVVCPNCSACSAMRINRNGFLQRRILGWFGYYPWKCGSCGSTFLYRRRGVRHSSRHGVSDPAASRQEQGKA